MNLRIAFPPFTSCFWLVIPILIGNILFADRLPSAFQPEVFWQNIPQAITVTENLMRVLMFAAITFMPLRWSGRIPRLGWVLFLLGTTLYGAAWLLLILAPASGWSLSAAGFLAPAYTPALWLGGIGLVGGKPFFMHTRSDFAWRLTFQALVAGFLGAHIAHTALIFLRVS